MKILVVEFSPSGGLYQFALQMADAYAAEGQDVELLTGRKPELRPGEPGVRLLDILPTWHPTPLRPEPVWRRKPRRAVRAVQLIAAWLLVVWQLQRSRPDVVQWAEWRFSLDAWFVARLSRRAGGPLSVDVAHTPRPFAEQRTKGSLYKSAASLRSTLASAYGAMDLVLVLGESARRDLLSTFPGVSRVEIIPHGDEGIFAVDAPPPQPAGDLPARILFFGSLARYKGLETLLDAFDMVVRQLPQATLLITGAAADVDVNDLRRRVEASPGAELRVGYVPARSVAATVSSARVVVAPYVIANQSGVVHLAQTFGRPVVATDVGDLGAVVADERTGLLVPEGDVAALAAALVRVLSDNELASRLGAAGARQSAEDSSWRQIARQVLALYQDLLRTTGRVVET